MSKILRENKAFLELLASTNPMQQRALLVTATPSQIHSICECVINMLYGTIPLDERVRRSMIPHRDYLYALADSTFPYADRKKLLVQKGGGFLDQLLPVILPALSFLI